MPTDDDYAVRTDLKPGDRVSGTIIATTDASVFVDIGARSEGIIDRLEFSDSDTEIKEGDAVDAILVKVKDGDYLLD